MHSQLLHMKDKCHFLRLYQISTTTTVTLGADSDHIKYHLAVKCPLWRLCCHLFTMLLKVFPYCCCSCSLVPLLLRMRRLISYDFFFQ